MQLNKKSFLATLAVVLLATQIVSCGGGSSGGNSSGITQVVSFGDSLSDTGTYAPVKVMSTGVKFTTNPAPLWNEIVASAYGLQLQPNAFVRFNKDYPTDHDLQMSVVQMLAGTSYAQGSARVSAMPISTLYALNPLDASANAPSSMPLIPATTAYGVVPVVPAGASDVIVGYSFNPANGASFAAKSGVPTALTAVSIKDQISNYLNTHNDRFTDNQLVTIQGGANDLFVALATYAAHGNMTPDANYCGGSAPTGIDNIVTCAAKEMALQLKRLVDKGATHILYANLPDVGNTPEFVLYAMADPVNGAATKAAATQLSNAYNAVVSASLTALGIDNKVTIFDTAQFFTGILASPPAGTVSSPNAKFACLGPASTSSTTGVTSLGCASAASGGSGFTTADAPQTYIFADGVHPSLLGHKLWGDAAAALATSSFPH